MLSEWWINTPVPGYYRYILLERVNCYRCPLLCGNQFVRWPGLSSCPIVCALLHVHANATWAF